MGRKGGKRRRLSSRMLRPKEGAERGLRIDDGSRSDKSTSSEDRERNGKTDSLIKLASNSEFWSFSMKEYLTRNKLFHAIESPSIFLKNQEEVAAKVLAILLRWTRSTYRDNILGSKSPREAWHALEEKCEGSRCMSLSTKLLI